jgi:hypothetical protein
VVLSLSRLAGAWVVRGALDGRDCDVVDDLGEFGVGGPVVADG